MSDQKRSWDALSREQRLTMIDKVIAYFETERNEKLGVIAAEQILDFFVENIGNLTYNKATDDVKLFLTKEFEDTLTNLDISLKKSP